MYCAKGRKQFLVSINQTEWPTIPAKVIIIIMEIFKAPTLRLKALNDHSIIHIMLCTHVHIMEMLSAIKERTKKGGEKKGKANIM